MGKKKGLLPILIICFLVLLATSAVSQEAGSVPKDLDLSKSTPLFNSYAFQSALRSSSGGGGIPVECYSDIGKNAVNFGFAANDEEAKFFIIGSIYSEAMAYLLSGDRFMAAKSLGAIEKEFINLRVPSSLYNYIVKMRNWVENSKYPQEMLAEFLSLFQPFYEDYAKGKGEKKLTLFRAGVWLVNMSLTAAVGDQALLRQKGTLQYFSTEMKRTNATKGVLMDLAKITQITEKKEITDQDTKEILELVKDIQRLLTILP